MDSFVALFRVVSQCRSGSLFKKQSNELKFCFRFETEFKMASLWNCGVLKKKNHLITAPLTLTGSFSRPLP